MAQRTIKIPHENSMLVFYKTDSGKIYAEIVEPDNLLIFCVHQTNERVEWDNFVDAIHYVLHHIQKQ